MAYKLTRFNSVQRLRDGAVIPPDERNKDYREYQQWLAAGNTPEPADPVVPVVPQVVTMRQARLALHASGLLDAVNAAITQAGGAAAIEWEYAQELRRDHPLVASITPALGITSEQLDALFAHAATL